MYSQKDLNKNYKYIIVPSKFQFLEQIDQYKTSSLTKFLLQKKGYTVFLDNEVFPEELANDNCLALRANVINKSDFLKVKSQIEIRDCYNRVLYTSQIGRTNEKKYKKAYLYSIRDAYNSMTDFDSNFVNIQNKRVKKLSVESESKKNNQNLKPNPTSKTSKKELDKNKESLLYKEKKKKNTESVLLYAQEIVNGFQLVNKEPKVIFIIIKTNKKNFFIIKNKNGVLYKNDKFWIAEYYVNSKLIQEKLEIKF